MCVAACTCERVREREREREGKEKSESHLVIENNVSRNWLNVVIVIDINRETSKTLKHSKPPNQLMIHRNSDYS